jgi:predicted tellurium resistance membrane protein TerC
VLRHPVSFAAKPISDFVNRHPTIKMLAFSFLILVGVVLVVDASHRHIPKGYIYFAMAFSIGVEMLNLRLRKRGTPVHLLRGRRHQLRQLADCQGRHSQRSERRS